MPSLDSAEPSDERLVEAALAGRRDAFGELFERYYPLVVHSLAAKTRDAELAEDLAQEAFLAAYRHVDDLADGRPFLPWLRRIAQNALRMEWRRQRSRRGPSLDQTSQQVGTVSSGSAGPEELASVACERDLVARALAELSPSLREALLLHVWQGCSAAEAAGALGISPDAAARRINRAKARFRGHYIALAEGKRLTPNRNAVH